MINLLNDKYYVLNNEMICPLFAFCGQLKLLQYAHSKGYNITTYAIKCAAYAGHVHILEWVKSVCGLNAYFGINLAFQSSFEGHISVYKWIIQNKIDV